MVDDVQNFESLEKLVKRLEEGKGQEDKRRGDEKNTRDKCMILGHPNAHAAGYLHKGQIAIVYCAVCDDYFRRKLEVGG